MKIQSTLIAIAAGLAMMACGGDKTEAQSTATPEKSEAPAATEKKAAESDAVIVLTSDTKLSPDSKLPTVVDFNATWCGPCRNFAPVFESTAQMMRGKVKFISVDVDRCPRAAEQFQVSSIPQVTVIMPDGRYNSAIGYMTQDELTNFISLSTGI